MSPPSSWNPGDYEKIEQAIFFLEQNFLEQPSLEEIASILHLSPFHFQRLFSRWAGISPKKFLQFLTLNHAKRLLENSHSVLEASLESGLSGPARLHDLFVTHEAVTPGAYKNHGDGLTISYGRHPTPFGECLVAMTDKGLCDLSFTDNQTKEAGLAELQSRWGRATLREEPDRTATMAEQIFRPWGTRRAPLRLTLRGTPFQIKVWEALLRIPLGETVCYADIARAVDKPGAVRAVGTAIGGNPVAFLIPCHRVIRRNGGWGQYRWGSVRKKALLAWEAGQRVTPG